MLIVSILKKGLSNLAKILIVDDDTHIRELVGLLLRNEGFQVYEASDGIKALKKLESVQVDMVILDIMMPNMDGWELCQELREFYDFPVLMLTAKRETSQKLKGFDMGTDDYLVKPFEPLELAARVKALLKRSQISTSQTIQIGNLHLNKKTYEVKFQAEEFILPLKEFELLFLMASYPGKTFTREQLIEEIWGYDYEGDERTVDVHIKRLRSRFSTKDNDFEIKTVRGLGYRLEMQS
ncbi:response regulator transcription factor [Oceanobacillus neutriphilus]|uniref:response regulator transcription factor n=1 Tax=Oceanobacillus neutriphilus TaxID=531815 RepID=UPI00166DE188|nr:response regulator transcription factor [Oceanobacillus neutriphilus]